MSRRHKESSFSAISYQPTHLITAGDVSDDADGTTRTNLGVTYIETSPLARIRIQTAAMRLRVTAFTDMVGVFNGVNAISLWINGIFYCSSAITSNGASTITFSLPAGTKIIEITNGGVQNTSVGHPPANPYIINGTFVVSLTASGPFTILPQVTADRILVYGDSIASGFSCLTPTFPSGGGWAALMRAHVGMSKSLMLYAFGGRSLYNDYLNVGINGLAAIFAALNPSKMLFAIGTNDYGQASNVIQNAANFGSRMGALVAQLHVLMPALPMFVQTPLRRYDKQFAPGFTGEDDFGYGSLQDYRNAESAAMAGLGYVTVIDGYPILVNTDMVPSTVYPLPGGVHPSTAGHAKYALALYAAMGI